MNRCFTNIITSDVLAVASLYEVLLSMKRHAYFG